MNPRGWNWQAWIVVAIAGGFIAAGIWAFGVDKPTRLIQLAVAVRQIDDHRAELGLQETNHEGMVFFYEAEGQILDMSLIDRPRSLYTDPIVLSSNTDNAPNKARITLRGLSDEDVALGIRNIRPTGSWGSSRFGTREPVDFDQLVLDEWVVQPTLNVRVLYHQPAVEIVRLLIYLVGGLAVLVGGSLVVWRLWLS